MNSKILLLAPTKPLVVQHAKFFGDHLEGSLVEAILTGEVSAEMARTLRNSLTTITGYAQQLAQNCDPDVARQLTADIIEESVRLDRTIGGFLASAKPAKVQALHGV